MRSLAYRFQYMEKTRPHHSSLMNFTSAIAGQGFSPAIVARWFNQLVSSDDYAKNDKRSILHQLYQVSAGPLPLVETVNEG